MADWKRPDYPTEFHKIVTDDDYVLTLTRITDFPKESSEPNSDIKRDLNKPAVLVVHGFICSGEDWFTNTPDKVLPYRLLNAGYDVWIANLRGTPLSRGHLKIPKESKSRKYWDFTWHEIGKYDVPAMIDYILAETGQECIYYIGHSMGCAILLVGLSLRPEYNSKVKVFAALAPAVHGNHITNKFFKPFMMLGYLFGKSKFLRTRKVFGKTASGYAKSYLMQKNSHAKVGGKLMSTFGGRVGVFGKEQIEKERMSVIATHWPSATPIKLFSHGIQCFKSGKSRQYDYGRRQNLKVYGQETPLEYQFENVKVPSVIFYSDGDELCPPKDVIQLSTELPNVIGVHQIALRDFSHIDFMFGKDSNDLVYDPVLRIFQEFVEEDLVTAL